MTIRELIVNQVTIADGNNAAEPQEGTPTADIDQ